MAYQGAIYDYNRDNCNLCVYVIEENYSVEVNSDEDGVAYVYGMQKENVREASMLIKVRTYYLMN